MNTHAWIPLINTIAFIPLFVILLANRPWDRKQKFFLLYLISAALYSLSDIFFRGDFFMQDKLLLVKVVNCIGIWSGVQFHYFLHLFYRPQGFKIPFAYALPASTIVLAVLGYIPRGIDITASGIYVHYGIWLTVIGFLLITLICRDVYYLVRKRRILADPILRNQVIYILIGIGVMIVSIVIAFAPFGGGFPFGHVGNLVNACILTYAVAAHRLLDFRVLFRRGLISTIYGILFISICLSWWFLFQKVFYFESSFTPVLTALLATLAIFVVFGVQARSIIVERVEQVFYGERIWPRRKLSDFTNKVYDAPTLEQFGNQLVSLLSQSIDCCRACLLLPRVESGDFSARFNYPPVGDNPMSEMRLRHDSPIVTWLERESRRLSRNELEVLPEFQGLWQEEKEDLQSAKVEMLLPLMHSDRLIAILAVNNRRDSKLYTVEDIDLMESVANHVAMSMEKEYLHEQLEEQGKELALINRLSAIVTSSVNIDAIFESFTQELKKVVDADYATIALIEAEQIHILALSSQVRSVRKVGERIPLKGTATQWVAEHKKNLYQANLEQHRRFWTAEHYVKEGIRSIVHLPLVARDEVIGNLIVASCRPHAYSSRQIRTLEHLALQIAMPIENSQLYARAEQRARIDELTGLFNRRHFEERLKEEIARHSRYEDVFSLLMLDLDSFKTYNDMFGHPSGDRLLNQIGRIVNRSIRSADQAFRYGGDEFVVILPQTIVDDAYVVAERVRGDIAAEMEAKEIAVTCSGGLVSYPSDGTIPGELITMADTALYYAKRTGGNRIYLSSKILSEPATETGTNARGGSLSTVYALVAAVDAKDHYTYGHSRKVNTYAVALAEAIGLLPEEVSRISTAALLHDIGKIGISDKILSKEEKLNEEEWKAVKSHPRLGANIVRNVPGLIPCVNGVLYHHERWDGTGYPERLKGDNIPLDARILAIADAYAAMTSARPYRDAFSNDKIVKRLRQGAGKQFDPELAEVFIGIVEAGLPGKVKVEQDPPNKQPNL